MMDVLVIRRRHNAVELHCIYTYLEVSLIVAEAMNLMRFWRATMELRIVAVKLDVGTSSYYNNAY